MYATNDHYCTSIIIIPSTGRIVEYLGFLYRCFLSWQDPVLYCHLLILLRHCKHPHHCLLNGDCCCSCCCCSSIRISAQALETFHKQTNSFRWLQSDSISLFHTGTFHRLVMSLFGGSQLCFLTEWTGIGFHNRSKCSVSLCGIELFPRLFPWCSPTSLYIRVTAQETQFWTSWMGFV